MAIDHIIIFTVILLPSADSSRRVVVSNKGIYVHEVLVNRLFKLAQEKSVVRWADHSNMTIAVDWDIKQLTKQTNTDRFLRCISQVKCFEFRRTSDTLIGYLLIFQMLSKTSLGLTWSWVYFSTAAGVPGTGVGSRWLECLTPNPNASLFSGSMLPWLHIFMSVLTHSDQVFLGLPLLLGLRIRYHWYPFE